MVQINTLLELKPQCLLITPLELLKGDDNDDPITAEIRIIRQKFRLRWERI